MIGVSRMIFVVIEKVMNGTVAMTINTYGIEAVNFEHAARELVDILKDRQRFNVISYSDKIVYAHNDGVFAVHGSMSAIPLKVLNE